MPEDTDTLAQNNRFIVGKYYKFDPPVKPHCISSDKKSPWTYDKVFEDGLCLEYNEPVNEYSFLGKPIGETIEHFFIIKWGKGSVAENISVPKLNRMK